MITRIYQDRIKDSLFSVIWQPLPASPKAHAQCEQTLSGAKVVLWGDSIAIQTIVHEVHHAVYWLAALGSVNGKEEEAQITGVLVEEVLASMLRSDWRYGTKQGEGVAFNTDVCVALVRCNTEHHL